MLLGIDHVVIAVHDPASAADELQRRVGLRATDGGRHDALGTFNRLVWLGDSYLELIGVFDPVLASGSWIGRPVLDVLPHNGGLATWAVATDSIERATAGLAGIPGFAGTIDGERRRPDGRAVRWRLAIPGALGPAELPFLIEHDTRAAEWAPAERAARAAAKHPIGGHAVLEALTLPVPNRHALAVRMAAVLGVEFTSVRDGLEARVGAQTIRLVDEAATARGSAPQIRIRVDAARTKRRSEQLLGLAFEVGPPASR